MRNDVSLRDVQETDLAIFFEQQLDPEAARMAAFPARDYGAFMAHWERIMADASNILKTIVVRGNVAGNIVSWQQSGQRNIGYWLGRSYWGQGIASAALAELLRQASERPLYAHVAKHNVASLRVLQKCGFTIQGEAKFHNAEGKEVEELLLALNAWRD